MNSLAQLQAKLQQYEAEAARLRQMRALLPPSSPEWQAADDALFEARCAIRHVERALRMAGRVWRCRDCGENYGPEWIAAWGLRCYSDCDGELEEVRT
jgi:hypothetical protein